MVYKLQSPGLSGRMIGAMQIWNEDEKSNVKTFSDNACEVAKYVHTGEVARRKLGLQTVKFNLIDTSKAA